jgi:hypothetical protein
MQMTPLASTTVDTWQNVLVVHHNTVGLVTRIFRTRKEGINHSNGVSVLPRASDECKYVHTIALPENSILMDKGNDAYGKAG